MCDRLLVTARDSAAAFHLIEVVRLALADDRFEVVVHAQEPAWSSMRGAGLEAHRVLLPPAKAANFPQGLALLHCARSILEQTAPDAVLCGLSTPFDGGLDEAVLAEAQVPTFLLQDFWGEQNAFFGRGAGHFLVLDEEAVRLSRERHGTAATVIGSPRHAVYADIDLLPRRRRLRDAIGADADVCVLGFFGQALHRLPGYRDTVRAWAEAVADFPGRHVAVYRPHPRESSADRRHTDEVLRAAGLEHITLGDCCVEDAILVCDAVCSAFSNCMYDVAYLNHFSPQPLITPVSLFFAAEVVEYFRRIVKLEKWPYLTSELVMAVHSAADLRACLVDAVRPETKRRFWQKARENLVPPTDAAARALDVIHASVRQGRPQSSSRKAVA